MTITEEYEDWKINKYIVNNVLNEIYLSFLHRINKTYFNDTLEINITNGEYNINYGYKYYINDKICYTSIQKDMEYLEELYNFQLLKNLKHKIERIYDNV